MKVRLNAGALENEVLRQPTAEGVQILTLALEGLNQIIRFLLNVRQTQVIKDERYFILDLERKLFIEQNA